MDKISVLLVFLAYISIAQAQSCAKPTPKEHMTFDVGSEADSYTDGSTVKFVCVVGYEPKGAGSPTITCTGGSWSTIALECTKKSCGSAGEPLNGQVDYPDGDNLFGQTAVFTCNAGYTLVGPKVRLCTDKGWDAKVPICEVVKCTPPAGIPNGDFIPVKDFYDYNNQVIYSCKDGLTLSGSAQLTCLENGEFDHTPPKCISVSCPDDDVVNGEQVSGSRPPHRYKATLTFKCNTGFVMEGEATQVCGLDNKWSPGLPVCKSKSTSTTSTPSKDKTTSTTPRPTKDTSGTPKTTAIPDSGNKLVVGLGIAVLVFGAVLGGVCWFIMKKKKRSGRSHSDPNATKDEVVALS